MWTELLSALALVLVIEGILPFVSPALYRRLMFSVMQFDLRTLRTVGLISMLAGLALLYVVR